MAEKQQDLGKAPVDLMKGPAKVPDGLPLTISVAKEVNLSNPQKIKRAPSQLSMINDKLLRRCLDFCPSYY